MMHFEEHPVFLEEKYAHCPEGSANVTLLGPVTEHDLNMGFLSDVCPGCQASDRSCLQDKVNMILENNPGLALPIFVAYRSDATPDAQPPLEIVECHPNRFHC